MQAPSMTPTASNAETLQQVPSEKSHAKDVQQGTDASATKTGKGLNFWMIMLVLMVTCFLSALDLTALSTALPTIAADLGGDSYSWIASSYALSSTSFIPIFAGLAQTFGRKNNLIASVLFFAVGSAICGSAQSMNVMIVGRTIAGVGGGGILSLVEILVADLVPLAERGLFFGLLGLVWAIASAIGPVLGGALAESNWRWLFYLNLPIAGLSIALILVFMSNLKIPAGSLREKLGRIDWLGSILFIAASTGLILGLSFGGDMFAWTSAAVLIPIIGGAALLGVFFFVEAKYPKHPIIPIELLQNRTTVAGYLSTFLHGIVSIMLFYYLPVYFQSRGHGAIQSGIDLFPTAFVVAPVAILTGISVTVTGRYAPQNVLLWVCCIVGAGLLTLIRVDSSWVMAHGLQVLFAVGLGLGYACTTFAVLAPLPPSRNAVAMGAHGFTRSFGQVLGITIGATALNNELSSRLPAEYLASLPHGAGSAFGAITQISSIPEPLRSAIRLAFADSLRVIWYIVIGLSGLGLLVSLAIRSLPLESKTDAEWDLEHPHSKVLDKESTLV